MDTKVYKRFKHPIKSTSKRLGDKHCDLVIQVDWERFYAHKCIIETVIPYIRDYTDNTGENSDRKVVHIYHISSTIIKSFVDFAYTGEITITEKTVEDMLNAAYFLQVLDVKLECEKFLKSHLEPTNVCRLYYIADEVDCLSLKKKCFEFMCRHIHEIGTTSNFLETDIVLVKDIMSSKELADSTPHQLFVIAMRWVTSSIVERRVYLFHHLSDLLKRIKFCDLNIDSIYDYVNQEEVMYTLTVVDRKSLLEDLLSLYKTFQEEKMQSKDRIILMDCLDTTRIRVYNPYKNRWSYIDTSGIDLKRFTCIVESGQLYAFGGFSSDRNIDDRRLRNLPSGNSYDFQSKQWIELPPMNVPRNWGFAVTSLDGYLYVCGGYHVSCFNNVEKYCIESQKWKTVSPMNKARGHLCVASLDKYIYAIGGCNNEAVALNSVERYDPESDKWKMIAPMHECRMYAAAATLNGNVFICGGISDRVLDSVEYYELARDRWRYTMRMNTARSHFLVLTIMNTLWAIGGIDTNGERLSTIEKYNHDKWSWTYVSSLPTIGSEVAGGVYHYC